MSHQRSRGWLVHIKWANNKDLAHWSPSSVSWYQLSFGAGLAHSEKRTETPNYISSVQKHWKTYFHFAPHKKHCFLMYSFRSNQCSHFQRVNRLLFDRGYLTIRSQMKMTNKHCIELEQLGKWHLCIQNHCFVKCRPPNNTFPWKPRKTFSVAQGIQI